MSPQQHIAHYRITAKLGEGGMGEVWRATDTKLNRDVAVKILRESFRNDTARMARFEREAQILASLNHPNIAAIYGIEQGAIVMELVEGEELNGPVPVEVAIEYAKQLAAALDAAHEKGIVHRDLKPANIKITPERTLKVLDFGLAKAAEERTTSSAGSPTMSPTVSLEMTKAGVILGTAAYMSPEQARGKPIDKRTDIWAFGVVLYEMLTGERMFRGETVSDTLIEVATREPDWTRVPPRVRRLLERCLEKDPRKRLRDIGDVWELLDDAPPLIAPTRSRLAWAAAALLAAIAAIALWAPWRRPPAAPEVRRYQIPMTARALAAPFCEFAVSPDGRNLAYITREAGGRRLWIHSLDSLQARAVPAAEEVTGANSAPTFPFWSPDSQYVAFVTGTKLRKVNISSGSAQSICDVSRRVPVAGAWNRDGVILVSNNGQIFSVSDAGGKLSPVVAAHGKEERIGSFPQFLPDGRHFLYYGAATEAGGGGVYIGSLGLEPDAQSTEPLLSVGSAAIFAADPAQPRDSGLGHIVLQREGTLFSHPFNAKRFQLMGEDVPVADQVGRFLYLPFYSVSTDGVLIYSTVSYEGDAQLTWFDRRGTATGTLGDSSANAGPVKLSPDGTRLALSIADFAKSTRDIWVLDIGSGRRTRLTFDSQSEYPVWSPDGSRIIRRRGGKLFRKNSDGTGDDEPLAAAGKDLIPTSWSRDGRYLLYTVPAADESSGIWVLPLEGDSKPFPFLVTSAYQGSAVFSPDGRWVAYTSKETGAYEIYVRPFPPTNRGKWLVSNGASGFAAVWRRDGRELYYTARDGSVMAVPVTANSVFQRGEPKAMFNPASPPAFLSDAMPDGNRFLVRLRNNTIRPSSPPFTVVLNWQAGLK
jgi:Tol biopolymer transport system component/predicted Ser/Thr protein kinase